MNALPISLTKPQRNWGWFWWAFQLFLLPLLFSEGNRLLAVPLSDAQLNFIFFCVNFIGTTAILGRFTLSSCGHGLRRLFRTLQSAFFGFALYYLALLIFGFVVGKYFPDYVNQNDTSVYAMIGQEPILMRIAVVFLVPVTEELLYRGVLFGSIYNKSRFLAYAISASVFSLIHIIGYLPDPLTFAISFVMYLPAGLCLAWAYGRSGSILAPILMHIAINQISIQFMR